jgi:NAD(P)-dependent dehydrogenase (short-subunit alcohol dehydrogenase family)
MSERLQDKVALVTGGSSGIGRASALAFAREGARVVIADVNVEGGQATAEAVRSMGGPAFFVQADVTSATQVEAMVAEVIQIYGRLDCAHNNAGVSGAGGPTADCPEELFDRIMTVNLKGVWLCMKYEITQMLKQGGGAIVNTSSAAGLVAWPGLTSAYVASKHGVVGLTKAAAVEYAPKGIRVNAVCPGTIRTPMVRGLTDPEIEARFAALHPARRIGEPDEVAQAVVWLCSDAASFVTGHAMSIDGGFVAR